MKNAANSIALFACACALMLTPGATQAGDPTPPPGPISPTMKTLDEVEPRIPVGPLTTPGDADSVYRITAPGSYYLTEDVNGVATKHGIEIAAIGVTLDLAGFSLIGGPDTLDGISADAGATALRISNGIVRDWEEDGIDAGSSEKCFISDIRLLNNAVFGIIVADHCTISECAVDLSGTGIRAGSGSVIERCGVSRCTNWGIFALDNCVVADCATAGNIGVGMKVSSGSIHGCTSGNNGGSGIVAGNVLPDRGVTVTASHVNNNGGFGIDVASSGTIVDCTAVFNAAGGIRTGEGSSVIDCVAFDSGRFSPTTNGIEVGRGSEVRGCTTSRNLNGILAGDLCTVVECTSESNEQSGIVLGANGVVADCTAGTNTNFGIIVGFVSRVRDCTAYSNGITGIALGRKSMITGCVLNGHAVAGIEVDNSCRIEDNLLTDNDIGVRSIGGGNMIVRNTFRFSGTADHDAMVADKIAPFEDPTTSMNPWANFSY